MIEIAIGMLVLATITIGLYAYSKFRKVDSDTDILNKAAAQARDTDEQLKQTLQAIQAGQASTLQQLDSTVAALQLAQVSLNDTQFKVNAVGRKLDTSNVDLQNKLTVTQTQLGLLNTDVQTKLLASQTQMNTINQKVDMIDTKVQNAATSAAAAQSAYTAIQSLQTTLTNQINTAMADLQNLSTLSDRQDASDAKTASLASALDTLRAQVAPNYLNWQSASTYWGGGGAGELRSFGTANPRVCWEECVSEPQYTGATFNPDKNACWIRHGPGSIGTGIARDFAYMKPRRMLPSWWNWTPATAYNGADNLGAGSTFTTADPVRCYNECQASLVCGGATFNPDKKLCMMRAGGGSVVPSSTAGDHAYKKIV